MSAEAERLRLFLSAIGEEPTMRVYESASYGFPPAGWADTLGNASPADFPEFDLAWACADIAHDLREQQWSALEEFCAAHAAGRTLDAVGAAVRLGWHHRLPDRD